MCEGIAYLELCQCKDGWTKKGRRSFMPCPVMPVLGGSGTFVFGIGETAAGL